MRFQYDHPHQEVGASALIKLVVRVLLTIWLILLLLECRPLLTAAAASDLDSNVASKVRSLELLKFEAQRERNVAALDSLFDDGLMWVNAGGVLSTKAGYMASLRLSSNTQLRIESLNVKVLGQMAVVVGIYDESGVRNNRPYHQRCRFIDTWTLKRDKWMLIAATATATIS